MDAPGERTLKVGHGVFDPLRGELALGDRTAKLRPRTAALFAYLVRHAGRPVGKDELMQAVWPDAIVTEDSLVQCVKEIRQALGECGHDWVRTLPRVGYAFVAEAPVRMQESPPERVAAEPPAQERSRTDTTGRGWKRAVAGLGLLALVLAGASGWRFWPARLAEDGSPPPRSFVVLPVVNQTGDPAQDRAAEEMTEAITDTFGRGRLTVVAPGTASAYKGLQVDVRSVGAKLNVRYVVQGVLRTQDAQPVLTVRMAEAATAAQLWQQDLRIAPGWAQQLREDREGLTTALISAMRVAEARRTRNPEAVKAAELLNRARDLMRGPPPTSEADRQLQVQALLAEAVRLDDQLASAWSILAFTHLYDVRFSPDRARRVAQAREAAERCLLLAPTSDTALVTRGWVYLEEGRPAQAVEMFDRALELNPKNAWAVVSRGYGLLHLGRAQEALDSVRQAIRLSPGDPKVVRWHTYEGMALLHLGQDAAALQSLTEGAKTTSPAPFHHLYFASALARAGRIDEARAQVAEFRRRNPGATLGRWRDTEPSQAPDFRRQREAVYAGLRSAGFPE